MQFRHCPLSAWIQPCLKLTLFHDGKRTVASLLFNSFNRGFCTLHPKKCFHLKDFCHSENRARLISEAESFVSPG